MNRHTVLRAGAACLLVLALAACGGGTAAPEAAAPNPPDVSGSPGPAASHAGMGPSTAQPTGQAFAWPTALQVERPIKGEDPFCVPRDQKPTPRTGSGGLVRLCLGFRNTGAVPVTVELPPGLIFVSDREATQNGIVLQTLRIEVPPGTMTYYVPVLLYCLNHGRFPTAGA
jgi:hypothetical protein